MCITQRVSPLVALLMLAAAGCAWQPPPPAAHQGSGPVVLKPLPPQTGAPAPRVRRVVYVPVYSSIYWGFDQQITELAATLSIRNVNARQPIVVHSVKYYDSTGKLLREYVTKPSSLGPMATADFVIERRDTSGGPGANFLVEWSAAEEVDEPVVEAVMVGQHGNAGISFTSPGRVLPKASQDRTQAP